MGLSPQSAPNWAFRWKIFHPFRSRNIALSVFSFGLKSLVAIYLLISHTSAEGCGIAVSNWIHFWMLGKVHSKRFRLQMRQCLQMDAKLCPLLRYDYVKKGFSRRGHQPLILERKPIIWQHFCRNCMKMKEIGPRGWTRVSSYRLPRIRKFRFLLVIQGRKTQLLKLSHLQTISSFYLCIY